MSTTPNEPTTTPPTATLAAPSPASSTPADPPTPARETDWKAEARKWEERAKANKDASEKLAEIEEASKTEAQKQAEALAAAQSKVKEYETREQIASWKAEVAEATGVPVSVLAGSTKEQIEAHAETIKPLIAQTVAPVGHRPIPSEGQPQPLALNGDGLEAALKSALGIK